MQPERIPDEFPAPSFRGNQKQALAEIRDAFADGNDVVLVRAPTGSGKSLLARAVMGAAWSAEEVDPSVPYGAYYTTPQVSQLDDVAADPLLSDLNVIRGKGNYKCILPNETHTPVDRAPCAREKGFDCRVKHRCPYYSDRAIASSRRIAAMTLAYFMQTAGSDVFRTRDVCVIDEAHGLTEWAEMYATIDLDSRTVPDWDDRDVPDLDGDPAGATRFAETLMGEMNRRKDELLGKPALEPTEAAERDKLQERLSELQWFVDDYRDPESATEWLVDQPDASVDATRPVTIKPLNPEKYLKSTVWDRARKFCLLSATILNKDAFCRQVGLDPERVALVDVGHTFPVENRPLFDVTQGKMTYEHRDETLPKIARLVVRLMAHHPDEKGLIHCHSYHIQRELQGLLADFGVSSRVRGHDRDGRDQALDTWKATDAPDVFLSVKMEEALDLEGDLARWQVLCKAPYPNTRDSSVAHRLELGQWAWYRRVALQTVIQACGRVVRAPNDHGATYLADSSLLQLFENAKSDVPPWFAEQVDRMTKPDLPDFDPNAAVDQAESGVASSAGSGRGGRATRAAGEGGTDDAGTAGDAAGGSNDATATGATGAAGSESGDSSEGRAAKRRRKNRNPLADAWDTE